MADEPIVEVTEEAQPATPEPVAPVVETSEPVVEPEPEAKEPAALEPGGERFKQVWARAKTAEAEKESLRQELQREREERIRLEERTKVHEETKKASEPEYTWEQLEGLIADGKITLGKAAAYREKIVREQATKEAEERLKTQLSSTSHQTTVTSELARYKAAVPEITQAGTPERIRVEREFAYLVNTLGYPRTYATELAATRAALGDPETVERAAQAKRSTQKESFVETHSSQQKPAPNPKDPVLKLTQREKDHYQRMIERGRYKDWNEVKEELEWQKPSLAVKRA